MGKLYVKLDNSSKSYRYTKETKASGLFKMIRNDHIAESSSGQLDKDAFPSPREYSFVHSNKKRTRKELMSTVDGLVEGEWKNKPYQLPAVTGEQDPASQDLALIYMASDHKQVIEIPLIEKGKQQVHRYRVIDKEKVRTKAGSFKAIHLMLERKNSKRKTEVWLAPELHFIPVKIVHKDKPDSPAVITELSSLSWKESGDL